MPKILIADDNNNIQKMVSLAFEERGIQVVSVGNGEAAVRRLADLNPDIVLADIFMPVRSGYEVCEYIKKDQRFSHIPVILLVGAFDPLDEKEARRVGADGVLKKPFVPPDPLIAMVTSVLEKNPRIAAELARAKDVVAEPISLPEPEIAAKIEVKPLPNFPEPTAEEAAMLYGFGNGRRSTFEDERGIEATVPVSAETQEDFEAEEASHDWRRAAMEFEVPQEVGGRPAFSDETAFPSVRDFPAPKAGVADFEERLGSAVVASAFDSAPAAVDASTTVPELVADEPAARPFASTEREIPEVEARSLTEPSVGQSSPASEVPHWMDALSSDSPASGWMDGLAKAQREAKEKSGELAGALALRDLQPALVAGVTDLPGEASETAAVPDSQSLEVGDSFFAEEPANDSWFAPAPAVFDAPREPAPETSAVALLNLTPAFIAHRADSDASRKDPNLVEPAAVLVTPEPLLDIEEADTPGSVSRRDPYLIESPAVHVNPEPLLDAEEPEPRTQVHSQVEEIAPVYALLAPEFTPAPAEESQPHQEFHEDSPVSAVESSVNEFSERIPTGPPPNREALAEIPFLTPPAHFHPDAPGEAELSDGAVDAVVQRVLERLEPRLQELLSQGVLKPLVENLLHSELAKKSR